MTVVDEATIIRMAADKSNKMKKETDYVHKGLEHALWSQVKGVEDISKVKDLRGKRAVEMMLKRKERCDRYTIESEPKPEEDDRDSGNVEEEDEEPEIVLEEIPVGALRGEIKLPPLSINPKNNSSLAKPFASDLVDPKEYGQNQWQRVPFSSTRLSANYEDMENSFMSTGASSNVFYDQHGNQSAVKAYKPIAFMNFKPKGTGLMSSNGGAPDPYLNDVLGAMEKQQKENDKKKAEQAARQAAADREAELAKQKKQQAIDARLYAGVHRMSHVSDWQKNAQPARNENFWNAVEMSEQIQAAKQ